MLMHGSSAVRKAKKKSDTRASRRSGFRPMVLALDWGLKPGESAETTFYFTGLFDEEVDKSDYLDDKAEIDTAGLDDEELMGLADEVGARVWKDMKTEHLQQSIQRRLMGTFEPYIWIRHFLKRNKGQKSIRNGKMIKKDMFQNCADPAAFLSTESTKWDTSCRSCIEHQNGDAGVQSPSQRLAWAVFDLRRQHRVKSDEGKDEYFNCTMKAKDRCLYCSQNRKIDPTVQGEMGKDHLKDLIANYGYSPVYEVGSRVLDLPAGQEALVISLATEIRMKMCRCGGNLKNTGAACPDVDCQSDFDFDELIGSGWNPDEPDPGKQLIVKCLECKMSVKPSPAFECDECDDPTQARLGDVLIHAKVIKQEKRSDWSFQPVGKASPIFLGDDPVTDRVLGCRMPSMDELTRAPSVQEQLDFLSLQKDPLGEVEVEQDPEDVVAPGMNLKQKRVLNGGKPKGKKAGFLGSY